LNVVVVAAVVFFKFNVVARIMDVGDGFDGSFSNVGEGEYETLDCCRFGSALDCGDDGKELQPSPTQTSKSDCSISNLYFLKKKIVVGDCQLSWILYVSVNTFQCP